MVELNAEERLFMENAIRRWGIAADNGRLLCIKGEVERKSCALEMPRRGVVQKVAKEGLGRVRDRPRKEECFESAILTAVHCPAL